MRLVILIPAIADGVPVTFRARIFAVVLTDAVVTATVTIYPSRVLAGAAPAGQGQPLANWREKRPDVLIIISHGALPRSTISWTRCMGTNTFPCPSGRLCSRHTIAPAASSLCRIPVISSRRSPDPSATGRRMILILLPIIAWPTQCFPCLTCKFRLGMDQRPDRTAVQEILVADEPATGITTVPSGFVFAQ